ncbi:MULTISPECIES: DinB family protein [Solibacillus]|mgnify:FL=1|uniref:DinB family protein n=1 Tax=Solibacillus merdavium TaxID=2762218 RepID=A0ABR8XN66_9BACL|nr:DinB family protein [Solibacillus merdavium]MBD8033379.1 DinB family protein [Solibacillus merdavium]
MLTLFQYNWQVRDDWFQWCESIPEEEFYKERTGGMKSIRETLIHIIDCELLWLNSMLESKIVFEARNEITDLNAVKAYSIFVKAHTKKFIEHLPSDYEKCIVKVTRRDGTILHFTQKKILAHIITHEIHHIGQLSIWARELALKPISSDLIVRNYE